MSKFLQKNYKKNGTKYCADNLNRTQGSINIKCYELKIPLLKKIRLKKYIKFSNDEIEFLKNNYTDKGVTYCAKILNKPESSIANKCLKLKIYCTLNNSIDLMNLKDKNIIYILGFIWADGSVKGQISTTISEKDSENVCYNFKKTGDWLIEHYDRYDKKYNKIYKKCRIRAKNKINLYFLRELGFYNKSIDSPNKLLSLIPKDLHHHFFRGYFDGDGCFFIKEKMYKFSVASTINQDWSFIIQLFDELKIEKYSISKSDYKSGKSSHVRIVNKWDIIKLGEFVYKDSKDLRLERKFIKYQQIKNSISKKRSPLWLYEDEKFLINNYFLGVKVCSEKLNRSASAIHHKIKILKNKKL